MEENKSIIAAGERNIGSFANIAASAPKILEDNKKSASNAVNAGRMLSDNAMKVGMSPALDEQMKSYIEKCRKTINVMEERRKPLTQMMDEVKKLFTTEEKVVASMISEIQAYRDAWASRLAQERKAREEEAMRAKQMEMELIRYTEVVTNEINRLFIDSLEEKKNLITSLMNGCTLTTYYQCLNDIRGMDVTMEPKVFYEYFVKPIANKISASIDYEERMKVIDKVFGELVNGFVNRWRKEMDALKQQTLDMMPSRQRELSELAKASEEERKRKEEEILARMKADEEKRKAQMAEEERKAREEAALKAKEDAYKADVKANADLFSQAPATKEEVEIVVKENYGYMLLCQQWFDEEGKKISAEKLEKMTFARIKKWCEKHTDKTGKKIISDSLEYRSRYTAK